MRYRRFGRTGLQVSELVLGGGWVGGLLIRGDDETRRKAIRMALDGGINWIDTAASYGDGKSEEALGWLLEEIEEKPYLSTKFSVDPARGDIAGQIERSFEASLERLRRSSVDLLQLHNRIGPGSEERTIGVEHVLGRGGVADALDSLREHGLTRFVGITALGDAKALKQVIASDRFDSAQVYYNLLNPSAGRLMPAGWPVQDFENLIATCREHDVAVMDIRVLAAGVIATDERHGREGMLTEGTTLSDEERRARKAFEVLGDAYGTRAQTAIRFALANPDLACVLVGVAELRHLEEALAGAEMGPLPPEALARLEPLYASDFGRVG